MVALPCYFLNIFLLLKPKGESHIYLLLKMRYLFVCGLSMFLGGFSGCQYKCSTVSARSVSHFNRSDEVFAEYFQKFKLGEVINIAEDVALFRFLLPNPQDKFSLQPCYTLQAQHKTGVNIIEQVQRYYTPISINGTQGYFDLVVKKQHRGRMTEHLFSMSIGESLEFRKVETKLKYAPNRWKEIGMIGGGTGLTPLLQVIRTVLGNPHDATKISLLYANRTENKIILKGLMDDFAVRYPEQFSVRYVVDIAEDPAAWKGYTGIIDRRMIAETIPKPSAHTMVLICGPDKMMARLVGSAPAVMRAMSGGTPWQPIGGGSVNNLAEVAGIMGPMGYDKETTYRF